MIDFEGKTTIWPDKMIDHMMLSRCESERCVIAIGLIDYTLKQGCFRKLGKDQIPFGSRIECFERLLHLKIRLSVTHGKVAMK